MPWSFSYKLLCILGSLSTSRYKILHLLIFPLQVVRFILQVIGYRTSPSRTRKTSMSHHSTEGHHEPHQSAVHHISSFLCVFINSFLYASRFLQQFYSVYLVFLSALWPLTIVAVPVSAKVTHIDTHTYTHTHTDTHTHDVNICYGFLSQYIGSIRGERRKKRRRRRRRKISASNVPPTNLCPPPSSLPGPQGLIDPLPCDLWPGFRGSGEVTKPVPYWLIQLTQTSTCPDQMQKNKQIWYWPLKVDCVMEEKKT